MSEQKPFRVTEMEGIWLATVRAIGDAIGEAESALVRGEIIQRETSSTRGDGIVADMTCAHLRQALRELRDALGMASDRPRSP